MGKKFLTVFCWSLVTIGLIDTAGLAEEVPDQLKSARDAYQVAVAEAKIAQRVSAAAVKDLARLDQAVLHAAEQATQQDKDFIALNEAYLEVIKNIHSKYSERIKAKTLPIILVLEKRELRRIYDILVDYRQYVEDNFFRRTRKELQAKKHEIEKARAAERNAVARIDEELRVLRRKARAISKQVERAAQLPFDRTLSTRYAKSLANTAKAEKTLREAESKQMNAFLQYVDLMGKISPPYLKRVRVTGAAEGGGPSKVYYDAEWKRIDEGPGGEISADLDYQAIREPLGTSLRIRNTIKVERGELHIHRLKLAYRMADVTKKLNEYADTYGSAVQQKVVALALVEIGVVVAEAALTGGTATAVRKAEEASELALNQITDSQLKQSTKKIAKSLSELKDVREIGKDAAKVAYEKAVRRVELARVDYINEILAAERKAMRNRGLPELRINRVIRKMKENTRFMAEQTIPLPKLKEFEIGIREMFVDQAIDDLGSFSSQLPNANETRKTLLTWGDQGDELVPRAEETSTLDPFLGEGVETLISAGTDASVAAVKLGKMGWTEVATASRLAKLKNSAAYIRGGVSFGNVRGALLNSGTVFSMIEASATVVVNKYYEGKINEAQAGFWASYATLGAMYRLYYEALLQDKELSDMLKSERQMYATASVILQRLNIPRHRIPPHPKALPIRRADEVITIGLVFSSDLFAAPVVRWAGKLIPMSGAYRKWRGTVKLSDLPPIDGEEGIQVTLSENNVPFKILDRTPESIAFLPPNKEVWVGYDRGSDSSHKLLLELAPKPVKVRARFKGHSAEMTVR